MIEISQQGVAKPQTIDELVDSYAYGSVKCIHNPGHGWIFVKWGKMSWSFNEKDPDRLDKVKRIIDLIQELEAL